MKYSTYGKINRVLKTSLRELQRDPIVSCYDFRGVILNPLQSLRLFVRYC